MFRWVLFIYLCLCLVLVGCEEESVQPTYAPESKQADLKPKVKPEPGPKVLPRQDVENLNQETDRSKTEDEKSPVTPIDPVTPDPKPQDDPKVVAPTDEDESEANSSIRFVKDEVIASADVHLTLTLELPEDQRLHHELILVLGSLVTVASAFMDEDEDRQLEISDEWKLRCLEMLDKLKLGPEASLSMQVYDRKVRITRQLTDTNLIMQLDVQH